VLAWLVLAAALIGTGHSGRFSLPATVLLLGCFVVVMLAAVRAPQPAAEQYVV
jgi:hypothetical protein